MEVIVDYERLTKVIVELAEALAPLIKKIKETWSVVKSSCVLFEEYFEEKSKVDRVRDCWIVPADTRKKSQVIDNKPKFMVRKVIR